jgi:hypothetical protein
MARAAMAAEVKAVLTDSVHNTLLDSLKIEMTRGPELIYGQPGIVQNRLACCFHGHVLGRPTARLQICLKPYLEVA